MISRVQERVIQVVSMAIGCPVGDVSLSSGLVDDLEFDDLDIVELVMLLEEEFGIELSDEAENKIGYNFNILRPMDLVTIIQQAVEKGTREALKLVNEVPESSGGDVNYYLVNVISPKRLKAYTAECEDIIEALDMSFSEGCAFKAIWRKAAARTLGKEKAGDSAYRNAQKVRYYGERQEAIELGRLNEQQRIS